MRSLLPLVIASCLVAAHLGAQGGDPPDPFEPGGWVTEGEPESAPAPAGPDASTPDYQKALELQKKGKWKSAQKAFREMLDKYPESKHKSMAEARSDDNAFLGCEVIQQSGPPERRIDVTVMGDGFTIDDAD